MLNESSSLSPAEKQFLHRLRRHPELFDRLQSLLTVADSSVKSVVSIDEIEAPVIELLRQVGNATLQSWATQAEAELGQDFCAQHPRAQVK